MSILADEQTLTVQLPAAPPTFAQYQLIHQTQQRQQYPEVQAARKPVTSDPWWQKLRTASLTLAFYILIMHWLFDVRFATLIRTALFFAITTITLNTLSWLYQRWEYWQSFRQQRAQPCPESFELTAAGLTARYATGPVFHAWQVLISIQQVNDWLLVYPGPDFCYYLDLRRVPSPHNAVDVLALIGKPVGSGPAATFAP